MQLTKGAGLIELIGFNEFEQKENYKIYKPLLDITKKELEEFLQKEDIKYFIDNSNFDEKYKRNYFRHNFSDKLLSEYSNGIKKSFKYLQNDINSLNLSIKPIKVFNKLEIYQNQNDNNLNIRIIDNNLKKRGFLLSSAQRNEIIKQKEITISHKINITLNEDFIWICPKIEINMDKKFKEFCRINKIPKNMRAYIYSLNLDLNELIF